MKPKPGIQQPKPGMQKPPLQSRPKHSDFSEEYAGIIKVHMIDNTIEGKLIEARRYWLKIEASGEIFYINKAYVVYIEPVKQTNGNTNPASAK